MNAGATIVRARVAHAPQPDRLEAHDDGALAYDPAGGTILAVGPFAAVAAAHPDATVDDQRGALLLPGLVDCHVHLPQLPVIGAMGMDLLDWLGRRALPAEARFADPAVAATASRAFLRALAANGTTSALVFGCHFPAGQEAFFAAAAESGLRIASGLVVGDRELGFGLELAPDVAATAAHELARRWHGRGRLRYAVTPRFSLCCTEAMLGRCGELAAATPGALVTTHLNESPREVARVLELFPWAGDYLETYERFGLVGSGTVLAHDVHPAAGELPRIAAAGAAVAHCPTSNAFLGSGTFPWAAHAAAGVRVGLGTDVGAGTGPSLFKEALAAYSLQRLRADGVALTPVSALHLATRAGAVALGLGDVCGDLSPGRAADFLLLRPRAGSTLAAALAEAADAEQALGHVLALAGEDAVAEVRVGGSVVHRR